MDCEKEIYQLKKENETLKEQLGFLEFRLELLAENSNVSNLLFECKTTYSQYVAIMDLMDEMRDKLDHNEGINHNDFENKIGIITGNYDYHFAELIARSFMEDDRWIEVFPALYGHMPKYKLFLEKRNKGE